MIAVGLDGWCKYGRGPAEKQIEALHHDEVIAKRTSLIIALLSVHTTYRHDIVAIWRYCLMFARLSAELTPPHTCMALVGAVEGTGVVQTFGASTSCGDLQYRLHWEWSRKVFRPPDCAAQQRHTGRKERAPPPVGLILVKSTQRVGFLLVPLKALPDVLSTLYVCQCELL